WLANEHEWIHALIDRALHKSSDHRIRNRIHALEIHTFNIHVSKNSLLLLIERQLDTRLCPPFELHAAGEVVATRERHRRVNSAVAKLHASLHAAAFRQERDGIRTTTLE